MTNKWIRAASSLASLVLAAVALPAKAAAKIDRRRAWPRSRIGVRFCGLSWVLVCALCLCAAAAPPPRTAPPDGLRENPPTAFALVGGRIVVAPGRVLEQGTIVVRDGLIEQVGSDVAIPPDAQQIDLSGKTIWPGLIDAYGETAVDPQRRSSDSYWNPQVTPRLDAADFFKPDDNLNEKLRRQGITARLVAPDRGIIKGTSALVSTADGSGHEVILRRQVALHIRLTISRQRRDQYPNSPMGAVALARQAFYDAAWYRQAWSAYRSDRTLPRPEQNASLATLADWRDPARIVIADAPNELFCLRADRFAREFGLNLVLRGSGNEYRRLEAIRAAGRPILVPVNFPQPPNVATPEAALNVTLEQLMHWDHAPENPARLAQAGLRIAITSAGLSDPSDFLNKVRQAVRRGLDPQLALQALTTTPAELFGMADRLGTIESGKLANLVVTDGDLFDRQAKILETWVAGRRYPIKPPPVVDVTGSWQATVQGLKARLVIQLEGEAGKLQGTVRLRPMPKNKQPARLRRIAVADARVSGAFDGSLLDREGEVQFSAVVDLSDQPPRWVGHLVWPDGSRVELSAERAADVASSRSDRSEPDAKDEKPKDAAEAADQPSSFPVNYPLGAFGRSGLPEQPAAVLFRGATIWTCGPQGVIEDGELLVGGGRILAVGKRVEAPSDAVVIDLPGRHITPGIIDCHSHMATDGGVNESTQAITAEVRIGDFINCDDISIYQQLAGGVTCANILHGSANPIGGQNQVIKLRWGALDEELKMAEAPPGIKFALGENVKQSNWGDEYTTRYPQTRMGVEQIIRDAFEAARRYQRQWDAWNRDHQGLPPRRDLELDALAEVLSGRRWIHCHSYRQDEILALLRLLESYGVQIGTLQHILEGYKVADVMAQHGAMASAFSDWWAYKFEVYDAIPYNGVLMHQAGVVVSFNSDDRELARHLNHEAAKAIKYGGLDPVEALKLVTLNPAKQLRIDRYVGSLQVGKHADLVVWSGPPLSNFSRCEQTWIDGRKYFDLQEDLQLRKQRDQMKAALVQKILASKQPMRKADDVQADESQLWPRADVFCHCRDGHEH